MSKVVWWQKTDAACMRIYTGAKIKNINSYLLSLFSLAGVIYCRIFARWGFVARIKWNNSQSSGGVFRKDLNV